MKYRIITNSNNLSQIGDSIIMRYYHQGNRFLTPFNPGNLFNVVKVVKNEKRMVFPLIMKTPKHISISFLKESNLGKNYADIFILKDNTIFVLDRVDNKLRFTTYKELLKTRLGARLGTEHFRAGTVGYNVYASITVIKGILGDAGEVLIGELFNSPEAQKIMALPNTDENNMKMAKLEYEYWRKVQKESEFFSENNFGGSLGSIFSPVVRTKFQFVFGFIRECPDKIERVVNWSRKKIDELL